MGLDCEDLPCMACLGQRDCVRGMGPCDHCARLHHGGERCIGFVEVVRPKVVAAQRAVRKAVRHPSRDNELRKERRVQRAIKHMKAYRASRGLTPGTAYRARHQIRFLEDQNEELRGRVAALERDLAASFSWQGYWGSLGFFLLCYGVP